MGTLQAFAADLAARSDAELRQLLAFRPDAMDPPVPNFGALAARLSTAASISRALDALNLPQLQALAAFAQPPGSNGAAGVDRPPGVERSPGADMDLAAGLKAGGLLISRTDDDGTIHYIPLTAVGPSLGGGPWGGAGAAGARAMPATVPVPVPVPVPVIVPVPPATSRNAAGSAADSLLRTMDSLAALAGLAPLPALRNGHPAVRTVRSVARELGTGEGPARFFLALGAAAGLLTFDPAGRAWNPVAGWSGVEPQAQWLHLVRAWLAGRQSPMGSGPASPQLPARLLGTLDAIAGTDGATAMAAGAAAAAHLGPRAGAPSPGSVRESFLWRHPRTTEPELAALPGLLAEAELLGLTGAGALSAPGLAAARNDWAAAETAAAALLPEAIDHFVVQGDFTAIAPGRLHPGVAQRLSAMAVPEGRGTAGIFRFSEASLAAAVSAGLRPADMLDFLRRHCSTTVPQSLEFLIGEAGRTHPGGTGTAPIRLPAPPADVSEFLAASSGVVHGQGFSPAPAEVEAQLELLRSNPLWPDAGQGETGPAMVLEKLRRAVELGVEVRLQAVDGVGETEQVTARPVQFTEGLLRTRGAGGERRFSIHRILAVDVLEAANEGGQVHG